MKHISEIINQLLEEWAYRVPNGMPDMNNTNHKKILYKVVKDLGYQEILTEKKEEKLTVHKGQNPTTFYHEVLTALAVAGVNMSNIKNGDDIKKYMGSKVKAGVPGKEIKNYPEVKYMENSTHAKFDKLKTDGINLAKKIKNELGPTSGAVWWSGPTNDSSVFGAADIVAKFTNYKSDVGVSLKYEKGQLKNLTVTTLGKALNLKNFNMDYIKKKYGTEFDGMTKDWNILIKKEFKKQSNSNKKLDTKQKKEALTLLTKLQRQSNTWDKYQKLRLKQDELDLLTDAVDMNKITKDKKFRYFCRKFQELKISKQWSEWAKKRNRRFDNIFGAAFKENEDDIEQGLITLFQKQLSMGKKDMFYAANAGKTFWFIPSEDRFADLVKDIHLEWDLENTGSGYLFHLTVYSSVTTKKIARITVTTRYTQGQMDGIGSKSSYKLYADDWSDIFGEWR